MECSTSVRKNKSGSRARLAVSLLGLWLAATGAVAAEPVAPFSGRPVAEVLDEFRDAGVPFAYSTGLVGDDLLIIAEPVEQDPVALVNEILAPHGLTTRTIAGVHLVVRMDRTQPAETSRSAGRDTERGASVENIVVSASRYEISRDIASSRFQLDRRSIQAMPNVGDDPIRITHRLPGAAASGASARSHFRGGNTNEVGIMLNGQWLFDPFHMRDYQSVFSAIDARAIAGVEVYTGGFPVQYGDRMSGLVLMESMEQEAPRHTEIGLSVFNTSFLTSGSQQDRRWLVSARRGNLDLVIDPKFGEPAYYDVFGEYTFDPTPDSTLSLNALFADDRVRVVLESDPDELEQVRSRTRNAQAWLTMQNRWSDDLTSDTVVSVIRYDNLRTGSMNDAEKIVAAVRDDRHVDQFGLRQDWAWRPSDLHFVKWGVIGKYGEASYDYSGDASYFGLPALYPGQQSSRSRTAAVAPQGASFAVYVSDRWRMTPELTIEWGIRWDDQTYTELASDAQISPRLNLLYAPDERDEYRLTWGRYHQSQGIHELQVEDGIETFWPAQRSDHIIAGFRHLFTGDVALRVEAFHKDVSRVRPRFENLFDPLGVIPEFQPDRIMLMPASARATGIEISIDRSVGRWDWWASYTLARVTDRIDGRNEPRSWDQRHAFQGGVTWSDDRWTLSIATQLHSGWPTTDLTLQQDGTDGNGDPVFIAVPGPRNTQRLGRFASLDFRLERTWDVKRGSLMAFFEVTNVLNRRNACCRDWDVVDGTGGTPALEHSYDYWMPLLPAVGILWEF